jgi:hypothetical protein
MAKRTLWACGAALMTLLGLAHVPRVSHSLAGWLGRGTCPWGGRPASAAELRSQRLESASRLRGTGIAPDRSALGLTLDVSSKADVLAWAGERGARCEAELGEAALRCVKPKAFDAFFRFEPRGTRVALVALDVMHEGASTEQAVTRFQALAADLERRLGEPQQKRGEASAAWLDRGYLSQAALELRFSDYAVDVSVTNLGERGAVLREQYRSLRP